MSSRNLITAETERSDLLDSRCMPLRPLPANLLFSASCTLPCSRADRTVDRLYIMRTYYVLKYTAVTVRDRSLVHAGIPAAGAWYRESCEITIRGPYDLQNLT